MFEGPEIHSSGVPAVQFPQYFDPLVVASALPGPAFSSRSMFSFPAPTLPINPPGCLPVWLPYLWISLAQSPGHWASFSSPPQLCAPLPRLKDSQENEVSYPGRWQGAQTLMGKPEGQPAGLRSRRLWGCQSGLLSRCSPAGRGD